MNTSCSAPMGATEGVEVVMPDGEVRLVPGTTVVSAIGQRRYECLFDAPDVSVGWHTLLHFEAVDYACAVWVNDALLGTHLSGYLPFVFDVTDFFSFSTRDTVSTDIATGFPPLRL